ncbi:unnamed protein product [Ambrosiozyma monospora]|uniref:Unnamed protein product n=1 Tax=Ambrosiozyma monospora TaxID=43982 RepID=A0ACB5U596_AMBMO|nr:unnamed protein product [Ambrosiozyma monospora]
MTDVWSGGIVYMYYEEANDYGLVSEIDSTSVSTLSDYVYYSSEMAKISPTIASTGSATATERGLSCPATGKTWSAADVLPPTPLASACECMAASLNCVVSDDVSTKDYGDLFGSVCGEIDCTGITADGANGTYGAYSFCNSKDQLSFVLNLYYEAQGGDSSACDFSGSATLQSGSTASSCSSVLSAAGSSGQGTISGSGATGTGKSGSDSKETGSTSGSGSKSGSSSKSSSTSSGAAAGGPAAPLNVSRIVLVTMMSGLVATLSVLFM